MNKNRVYKEKLYQEKYGHIPIDYEERLNYMIDHYNISESKMDEIINKKNNMLESLCIYECKVVELLEEPEGAKRSRFRMVNKKNFNKMAIVNPSFIHVYTPGAVDDYRYMQRLCNDELIQLNGLINTPCLVQYTAYLKTPSNFNINDTMLAEIGLIRPPIEKPDWDNIGKKYCDMYRQNVWLDDTQVIDGRVEKYYSILPRVEIKLQFVNTLYNKQQYKKIINRKDYDGSPISYLDKNGRINKDE